jgi:hypothetical protein
VKRALRFGEAVEVGCFIEGAAVDAEVALAEVVGEKKTMLGGPGASALRLILKVKLTRIADVATAGLAPASSGDR